MVEMLGFRKPTPMMMNANARYMIDRAPSSRFSTPSTTVAGSPSKAIRTCPQQSRIAPQVTARRNPRYRSAMNPPMIGIR